MTRNDKKFKANYNGETIRPGEIMVPFPYDELDAQENYINKECIRTIPVGGRYFRVIYKAVDERWAKNAASALSLVENEELGHYTHKGDVSIDSVHDEYELELGVTKSAEDEIMERIELDETIRKFVDLVSGLIERIPKLGFAVLLLQTGIKGEKFYDEMLLTRDPANRIRKQAEDILRNGLINLDIDSIKCYKSKDDGTYRDRAYKLLDEIVKKFQ